MTERPAGRRGPGALTSLCCAVSAALLLYGGIADAGSWLIAGLALLYVVPLIDRSGDFGCAVVILGLMASGGGIVMSAAGGWHRNVMDFFVFCVIFLLAQVGIVIGLRKDVRDREKAQSRQGE